jgi:predicted ribonuclease YlaK
VLTRLQEAALVQPDREAAGSWDFVRPLLRATVLALLDTRLHTELLQRAAQAQRRTNLPIAPTTIVGRLREQAVVRDLLRHAPLITLRGVGGRGKTRLAQAVAASLLDTYPDPGHC